LNLEPYFSVVVPFYNEGENLPPLIAEIDRMLHGLGKPAEIILVNDGSTDQFARPASSPRYAIRWLALDRNSGQSAALYYGMQVARGEWLILLDADLQNDPADIPAMLQKLEREKLDLITGVRAKRNDNWIRRAASQIGNAVRSTVLQDRTSDTGCTLKIIRASAAKRLPGWNGMHRFIPALTLAASYEIGEMAVSHRARHAGISKVHGGKRAVRVIYDLFGMFWLKNRQFKGRLLPEEESKI
jgi:dolichol-phosphate mannosyltransferase